MNFLMGICSIISFQDQSFGLVGLRFLLLALLGFLEGRAFDFFGFFSRLGADAGAEEAWAPWVPPLLREMRFST